MQELTIKLPDSDNQEPILPETQVWKNLSVELLNQVFEPLTYYERLQTLYRYFPPEAVLFTSSFGTKSVLLLYLLHLVKPSQTVHFINTTYHFPQTLAYKETLQKLFNLNIVEVLPNEEQNKLTAEEQWWVEHPRMCCTINKIAPLAPIIAQHKVWISGLMAYQTNFRKNLRIFEQQGDIIKFHPFIDLTEPDFEQLLSAYHLPPHPLEMLGFGSVGCTHCTQAGKGREGRWSKTGKTECGLHPGYFTKQQPLS